MLNRFHVRQTDCEEAKVGQADQINSLITLNQRMWTFLAATSSEAEGFCLTAEGL